MRVFIPALTQELAFPAPVCRGGWAAFIPVGTHPEQAEVFEDDAVTEAALDGLRLLRDQDAVPGQHPRRLVLALTMPDEAVQRSSDKAADEEGVVFPVEVASCQWADVDSLMVDDADAEPAVRAVLRAQTQDEADEAISELWEFAIGWFDIAERQDLITAFKR